MTITIRSDQAIRPEVGRRTDLGSFLDRFRARLRARRAQSLARRQRRLMARAADRRATANHMLEALTARPSWRDTRWK